MEDGFDKIPINLITKIITDKMEQIRIKYQRVTSLTLLLEYNQNQSLINHALSVEG
jgi:predicted hydrolase (HD superfamily)